MSCKVEAERQVLAIGTAYGPFISMIVCLNGDEGRDRVLADLRDMTSGEYLTFKNKDETLTTSAEKDPPPCFLRFLSKNPSWYAH